MGVLMHHGGDFLECLYDFRRSAYAGRLLSDGALEISAIVDFRVPDVSNWSIGFMLHDKSADGLTMTYVYRSGNSYGASHRVWKGSEIAKSQYIRFSRSGELRTRPGHQNRLGFVTDGLEATFTLNGDGLESLLGIPLTHRVDSSKVCVGLNIDEDEDYSIEYSNLWVVASN